MENTDETFIEKASRCFENENLIDGAKYLLKAYYESDKSKEILGYFDEIFFKPNLEELERIYNLNLGKLKKEANKEIPEFKDLPYYVIPIDEEQFYLFDKSNNDIISENFTKEQVGMIELCTNENFDKEDITEDSNISKVIKNEITDNKENVIIVNTDEKEISFTTDNIFDIRENFVDTMTGKNAPLVSIYVLAYNNLEKYTKTCVECILKYTEGVDYELVLCDNGSNDGTFEYFKTVPYDRKKIIRVTKNIGAYEGARHVIPNCSGKYIVCVANDLYVTKNWLNNMLKCAMSDSKIGMVNPMSDYISNNQSVDLDYKDFNDMQKKAAAFNISDPKKWEERIRLITLGTLWKKACLDTIGFLDYGFIHDFADDDISFRIRRAGYKIMLCKDVFISHAGKITDKGSDFANQSLIKGRQIFKDKYYGIDAWDDVCNFEPNIMSLLGIDNKKSNYKILGIDVCCGTPLLEMKSILRKKNDVNIELSAFTTEAKYWLDLSTICDTEVKCDRVHFIRDYYKEKQFDYIVLGKQLNRYSEPYKLIKTILSLLSEDGELFIKVNNDYDIQKFLYHLDQYNMNLESSQSYVDIQGLNNNIESEGFYIEKIVGELHVVNSESRKIIESKIQKIIDKGKLNSLIDKLFTKEYIIKIKNK